MKRKLKPVLWGDFRVIGRRPDLKELNGNFDPVKGWVQECVDHHIFKADDNKWHLWGCVRGTKVGRILYHWKADSLYEENWEETDEIIRCSYEYGENLSKWGNMEWIQSPFIVKDFDKYFMFYGGHSSQWDTEGYCVGKGYPDIHITSASSRGQICLMISDDGLNWERYKNYEGYSRVFIGPGEARDPSLIKVGDIWHIYYTGAVIDYKGNILAGDYVRTSKDLIHWSDWELCHRDPSVTSESNLNKPCWTHECPTVVFVDGYYYLFRTENYSERRTHVYRSEDPKNFGYTKEDAKEKYVGTIEVGAPEIIQDDNGDYFITSNHMPNIGTMMCRLKWEEQK